MGFKEFTPIGPISTISVVGCISYAIVRHHLMDIRLAITKATIFFIIYLLTFIIPFYIGYMTKSWVLSTLAMAILATIGPIMHKQLQTSAENVLLAKQKRYQKFLLSSAKGMIKEHDLNRLMRLTVYVIKRSVKPQFVAIFLKNESGGYSLQAWRNHVNISKGLTLLTEHKIIQLLNTKQEPIVWEEAVNILPELPLTARLIVPALNDKELLGIMVMGEKEDKTTYTQEDSNIFDILSRQAALAIDNCLYIEAFKRNQQRLFEAEKLAGLGGMAAGMSHQFKNRLHSFTYIGEGVNSVVEFIRKSFPDLLTNNKSFCEQIDYLNICAKDIHSEVCHCSALVNGIVGYSKEKTNTDFKKFSFAEATQTALSLVKIKHECVEKPLPFEFIANIPSDDTLFTVKGSIIEILFNLLDNAYESIDEKIKYRINPEELKTYKPEVKVTLLHTDNHWHISVTDNGVGIKEEDTAKIFAPFFTTKPSGTSGMGMGMYIIKRMIVEQMKGKIWFESRYLHNAVFFISLPTGEAS